MKTPRQTTLGIEAARRCPKEYLPELTGGSVMPIGYHKGKKMMEVPFAYWRWFLQQEWREKHPNVLKYALQMTAGEREQLAQFAATHRKPKRIEQERTERTEKRNPEAGQKAFEEFRKLKETL